MTEVYCTQAELLTVEQMLKRFILVMQRSRVVDSLGLRQPMSIWAARNIYAASRSPVGRRQVDNIMLWRQHPRRMTVYSLTDAEQLAQELRAAIARRHDAQAPQATCFYSVEPALNEEST